MNQSKYTIVNIYIYIYLDDQKKQLKKIYIYLRFGINTRKMIYGHNGLKKKKDSKRREKLHTFKLT